jgi:hypothetical protein
MTPAVEDAVRDYVRQREYIRRTAVVSPLLEDVPDAALEVVPDAGACAALASALGLEWVSRDQADAIADAYLQQISPPIWLRLEVTPAEPGQAGGPLT